MVRKAMLKERSKSDVKRRSEAFGKFMDAEEERKNSFYA